MMKNILFAIFLLPLAIFAEKFNVDIVFRPAVVTAGEPVEIILISNKRGNLSFDLPAIKGGTWLKNYVSSSTQTSIVNGVVSTTVRRTIPVMTEQPGALTIPPFTVKCGKETATTRELVIKVVSASDKASAPGTGSLPPPVGEITVPLKGRTFYVGEEIPLSLSLYLPMGLEVRELSYPQLSGLDNAVLTDYSKVNPRNRFFAPPAERRRVIGNQEYTEILFRTGFRALKAGIFTPGAVASVGIVHRSQSRTSRGMFDDDFFDGFFSNATARVIPRQVRFKFNGNNIAIQPLPPMVPGKSHFLNLVGNWNVSVKLGSTTAKVGEPVELTVTLTGNGSGETLSAPALQIPGFRIYPPEVKKYADRIEIKYALIPLEVGERKFSPSFAIFNPVSQKYVISKTELVLPVSAGHTAPATVVTAPVPENTAKKVQVEPGKEAPEPKRNELFYQKSNPGKTVYLPLMRNQMTGIIVVLVAGVAACALLTWRNIRLEKEQTDGSFRLKRQLRHQLKDVLAELKQRDYSADSVRETAVPYLAQALGLFPGTTPEELAEKISDPELSSWLRALNSSGFMPGSSSADSRPDSAKIRSLIKALKKYAVLLFVLGTFSLFGSFNTAFDKGDLAAAQKEYEKFVTSDGWSANALYNLGSVCYMKNDLPRARLYFMRALLIAPWDSEIQENLNLVNRKLVQKEIGSTSSPGELLLYCRNRLRPDQYFFLTACAVAVLLVSATMWKRESSNLRYWVSGIALAAVILFAAAGISLANDLYDPACAVVISKEIKLRNLPVSGGKVEVTLPGGASAKIVESRDGWSRIKINGQDGWVESKDIESVFPGGIW